MLASDATTLPLWLYSTTPLWPLIGAIVIGLTLYMRRAGLDVGVEAGHGHDSHGHDSHGHDSQGHGHDAHGHGSHGGSDGYTPNGTAHWPVVLGATLAAILAVVMFFDLRAALHHEPAGTGSQPAVMAETPGHGTAAAGHGSGGDGREQPGATVAYPMQGFVQPIYNWISLGSTEVGKDRWLGVSFLFDGLTAVMMLVVCVVALMVVLYSVGYMRDHHGHPERGYERFFAFLGLFIFSMSMLVLGGNFVLLYLGWELVGLCSYLLIGFYYKKPEAAAAAKKAFIVNRIGDFGFALGIFAIYYYLGMGHAGVSLLPGENPLDYTTVFKYAGVLAATPSLLGMSASDLISILLLCGALGKSAQFPLYVWLPDAMEGPSPVSALIHAATMVTAGVYMMARCGPLFANAPVTLDVVIFIGAFGALLAATMAMAQYDMKRILAYSTMSQLAYMFVAVGVGAADSGVFHLYTHAFFKALLFLTAGSVMHAMGNIIDLREFSGLRRVLPQTYKLMAVGCFALAGVPLLAGFWSKDEIVHAAWDHSPALGLTMLAIAAMTAYYTFRMFFMCFHGPERFPREAGAHPHEATGMLRPLYVLALGAIVAGYLGVSFHGSISESFLGFLAPHGEFHHVVNSSSIVKPDVEHSSGAWLMYTSSVIALAGIGLAWVRYGQAPQDEPDRKSLGLVWNLWNAKYYVDEIYDAIFVRPLRRLGDAFFAIDRSGVDGVVNGVGAMPSGIGHILKFFQQGALQGYALLMVIGVAGLLVLWRWLDPAAGM
ncbi:MAG: NADH dehydrogenase subunit L [Planctomycetota bacterium]